MSIGLGLVLPDFTLLFLTASDSDFSFVRSNAGDWFNCKDKTADSKHLTKFILISGNLILAFNTAEF